MLTAAQQSLIQQLTQQYPCLADISPALWQAALPQGMAATVPAGTVLFKEDTACQGFPFVLAGSVQVRKASADGRGLALYQVGAGEMCVASTSCLFAQHLLQAEGVAQSEASLFVLPPQAFLAWLQVPSFRDFVMGQMSERMVDLMALVEAVAFQKLDQRLAHALLGHGAVLHCTHQSLADALGTVREMVTRLLKRFAAAGLIELGREQITLLAPERLRHIAQGEAW